MFAFLDHLSLLSTWIDRRQEIAERLERVLLNTQGKATSRRRDRPFFERTFDACFFDLPGLGREAAALKGQLRASHVADGFEPTRRDQFATELDPLELLVRAYERWDQSRWPGASGRLTYAGCLFAVFIVGQLEWLSLRVWDEGSDQAGARLSQVQALLDRVNAAPGAVVFVRDAAWLIQTAQGPLTPHLEPYFRIADHIAASFDVHQRTAIHAAGAKLAGGHMRSQLRYGVWRTGHPIDHPEILAFTRNTNAMDHSLLVRDLVGLLEAYEVAVAADDPGRRLDLADAILQGMAVDPELYLVRLDLLLPYTAIEGAWVAGDHEGGATLSPAGVRATDAHREYCVRVDRLAAPLLADAPTFDPVRRPYSPFGIVYGFVADVMANIAMGALVGQTSLLSLEDVFESRATPELKCDRAEAWATLPIRPGERAHFEHTTSFAADVFGRLLGALTLRAQAGAALDASGRRSPRLFVVPTGRTVSDFAPGATPPGDVMSGAPFVFTTDPRRAATRGETEAPVDHMRSDRKEGALLASAEIDGQWVGLAKLVLTFGLAQGRDVLVTDLPVEVVARLRVTCGPHLVVAGDRGAA